MAERDFADERARLHILVRQSIERVGVDLVASHLDETPSALRNQVAGRRALPEGAFVVCWLLDPIFRARAAEVCDEVLTARAVLTPEEVVRAIAVEAGSRGYVSKERVHELVAGMRSAP